MEKNARHFLLLFFLTIKLTVTFYTFVLVFSPVFVYRWILSKLHRKVYPENVGIVSPLSSTYVECDGNLKSAYNIIANLKFNGHIPLDKLIERVTTKIINATDESGRLLYPELQQCIQLWYGYPFWSRNNSFDVRNHILSYEELINNNTSFSSLVEKRDEAFCQAFQTSYVQEQLKKGQSPWEMIVINNVQAGSGSDDMCTVVVFKFQHCLADGYSIFNSIMKIADTAVCTYKPVLPSKFEQTVAKILYPVLAPVHMAQMVLEQIPNTPWDKTPNAKERVYGKTKILSMTEMKKISSAYKVPFTAVLFGMLGNAIRSYMKKNGKDVPEFLQCGISLPTTNHPEGLANDWYFTDLKIPLQGKTQLDMIKYVAAQFPHLRRSTLHVTRQIIHKLIFMLPIVWKWKTKCYELFYAGVKRPWPTLMSTMPGPKEAVFVDGHELVEMNYIYNRAHGNPCLMTMLSYQSQFQFWFSIDNEITFGQGVESLVEQIHEQFENLDGTLVNNLLN